MKAMIITVGDEILMGQILDTNSKYAATALTKAGLEVIETLSVADRREAIYQSVDFAIKNANLVIVTGGLGPTKDDITKKVLCDYFETELVFNQQAYDWLTELLSARNLAMNENNRSQAYLPECCRLLHNFKGTAAGMWFEREGKTLISLPGVPFEMEHLIDTYITPYLREKYPYLEVDYRMLRVYNIPESQLAHHLEKWEDNIPEGIGLAYLPSPGLIKLRVTARGQKGLDVLDKAYESLKEALAPLSFTEGEQEATEKKLGELLREKKCTLATAESCTGGAIAQAITSVAGASDYFKGSVVSYADEVKVHVLGVKAEDIKKYGVVSETVARQMAEGARRVIGTDFAVSTTGVAGPSGGTPEMPVGTVWIAVASPAETIAQKFIFSATRERNIGRATQKAIEMVIAAVSQNYPSQK